MFSELKHVLIIEDERGRHEHTLDAPLYSIGRDPKCDIRINSQYVSRRHATLVQLHNDDGSIHYRLVDGMPKGKPSSNGLLVNKQRIQAVTLQDCDEIMLGPRIRAIYKLREWDTLRPVNFDDTVIPQSDWGDNAAHAPYLAGNA